MADITLDKIIRDAATLSQEEQRRLLELLTARDSQAGCRKTIEQLAAEQHKSPLDFAEVRRLGSFFPDEESVDDLIGTVRSLRQDESTRMLG
ncbi:MAG: hypothetical protein ACREBG_28475 [Pyrinomonadaceae bacterium]